MDKPLYEYKRVGYRLAVYPNRIEYTKPGFPKPTTDTILMKSVTGVSVAGMTHELQIATQGQTYKLSVFHKDAEKAHQAILNAL